MHSLMFFLAAADPVLSEAQTWTDYLREGGGWAMFGLSCVIVTKLWMELKSKDQRIFELLDKQNEILKLLQGQGNTK